VGMRSSNAKMSRRGRKKARQTGARISNDVSVPSRLINRSLNFMPSVFTTTLRFNKSNTLNNVGSATGSIRFTPTYAYDVDPSLGSTAMPGYLELSTLYRNYRMRSCRWRLTAANADVHPVIVYVCPVNFDTGANYAGYQALLSNNRSKKVMLSLAGGLDRADLQGSFNLTDFGGSVALTIPDSYSGTSTGTDPGNNIYLNVGIFSYGVLANGVPYSLDIEIELDFFELATPAT